MKETDNSNQPEMVKKEEKTRLSIIIPVFNAEATLPRCLDSILEQGTEGIEIICVNDGSKDGSLKVLRQYEMQYPKIMRIIDQENKGVSVARNAALEICEGEYVTMVDADDYIFPNVLTSAVEQALDEDCDIIFFGVVRKARSGKEMKYSFPEKFYSEGERLQLLQDIGGLTFYGAWGKFFKRNIIGELRYSVKMHFHEDVCFNYTVLTTCRNTFVSPIVLYCYDVNFSNATAKYGGRTDVSDLCSYWEIASEMTLKLLYAKDNIPFADKEAIYYGLRENLQTSVSYRSLCSFYTLYRSNVKGKFREMEQLLAIINARIGKGWEKRLKNGVAGICGKLMQYPLALHIFLSIVFGVERLKRSIMG